MATKRVTISDIACWTSETAPYFFSRKTLGFFGQRMKDFSVRKDKDNPGCYIISAPMHVGRSGRPIGMTIRRYRPDPVKPNYGTLEAINREDEKSL